MLKRVIWAALILFAVWIAAANYLGSHGIDIRWTGWHK
jgi:hypothetical protein